MSTCCVHLFGKFCIQCNNVALDGFEMRKVQELFCYLLLYRNHSHTREALASLLWGDHSTTQSKTYLRKALWQLQTALATPPATASRLLRVDPNWVQINSDADLWLDVAEFEQAFAPVQGVPGEKLDERCIQILRQAVDLYRADLLEGWYQDWCLYERQRLQHIYLAMLDKLMAYCEAHHEYETGLVYGEQILYYDRAHERSHRRLMRMYYLSGDRTAALRQYERCVAALDEELGVKPDEITIALCQQIRANQLDRPAQAPHQARPALEAGPPLLIEVLDRLKQFQMTLNNIQQQVQQDIQAVERALRR